MSVNFFLQNEHTDWLVVIESKPNRLLTDLEPVTVANRFLRTANKFKWISFSMKFGVGNSRVRADLVQTLAGPERLSLSRRDQGTALLVFMVLGLIEEITVSHAGWLNERIVAVCAAGLVAGPWVGLLSVCLSPG